MSSSASTRIPKGYQDIILESFCALVLPDGAARFPHAHTHATMADSAVSVSIQYCGG